MNFKLSFLCILLVNFLPQSFASPRNSSSRTVDELVKEIEEDQKLLHELLIKEGVLKTNEPPSETAGEAKTTEKAPTTSQSTLTENDTTTELSTPLTNNATLDNATLFLQSPTLNKTAVTTKKTTAANIAATAASSSPITPATIDSKGKSTNKSQLSNTTVKPAAAEPKPPSSEKSTSKTTYSSTTTATNVSVASSQAGSGELPENITAIEPSKKNDSIKSGKSPKKVKAKIVSQNGATTTEKPTMESMTGDQTSLSAKIPKQAESRGDGLINRSHFPTIFMVILAIVLVIYMIYHNRNKIHNFIKKHRSGDHESSPGYVKVKVDDDLDLPRDANRHYVY